MSDIKYWNSIDQLTEDPGFINESNKEFQEEIPVGEFLGNAKLSESTTSRRDFLKFMGFSLGAATLAACETPVTKSIPYVVKPEEVTPGVANFYASAVQRGGNFASILVKTREGRPIFIQPNDRFPAALRGMSPRVNSSVLELYDENRYMVPQKAGANVSWSDLDADVASKLMAIKAKGGNIALVTGSVNGPGAKAAVELFSAAFSVKKEMDSFDEFGEPVGKVTVDAGVTHVQYDAINTNSLAEANSWDFGTNAVPHYRFDKAKTVVSIAADFLGDWGNGASNSIGYAKTRVPSDNGMSRHYQFETNLTRSGSTADVRGAIRPSDVPNAVIALYNAVASKSGAAALAGGKIADDDNNVTAKIASAADDLWASKGNSLVVCGSENSAVQRIINATNQLLGNYGSTITWDQTYNVGLSSSKGMKSLINDMNTGAVDAVIISGVNPCYAVPGFAAALMKVGLKISLADRPDETSSVCDYVAPNHFFLEGWNDYEPITGVFALAQPCIKPLFKTRQAEESLLVWAGSSDDYYTHLKKTWEKELFPKQSNILLAEDFWNTSVQNGVVEIKTALKEGETLVAYRATDLAKVASGIQMTSGTWECQFYFKQSIGDGTQANNPHLQEFPDPISKISWDNYVSMNPSDMNSKGWETRTAQETPANLVNVTVNGVTLQLPVVAVPGQKVGTIGIALGYGREITGPAGKVGKNAYSCLTWNDSSLGYSSSDVSIEDAGATYEIASVQTHHTMMGRKIVNETTYSTYSSVDKNDEKNGWNKDVLLVDAYGKKKSTRELNLWQDHAIEKGHRWGMSIDLNACNACGACVTACHTENNVPVVGKDEIRRTRSMFWLRVDRYFSSDVTKQNADEQGMGVREMYRKMEDPSVYPQVSFQPVMCQHCNHAPCETVCPVAATTHSEEGLNQMAYNRCVGTRYCANNCPYKVRRFNWFNYNTDTMFAEVNPSQNDLMKMVLNPDVVVRSRGVIEKCSFCVQKIQAGKLVAKKEGRPLRDGDVTSACAGACATGAIKFGDLNDDQSAVRSKWSDSRSYHLIEEVGTQPNVAYLTKVRNIDTNA
ncbi:MAG: TAT-variant-translocated molybdopterin oxidoreductase [Flavobacteriales bacterium]|nr:TAT-variant-translocated molybdopterin oxidoreductase [Flavobacteriales bacterium]